MMYCTRFVAAAVVACAAALWGAAEGRAAGESAASLQSLIRHYDEQIRKAEKDAADLQALAIQAGRDMMFSSHAAFLAQAQAFRDLAREMRQKRAEAAQKLAGLKGGRGDAVKKPAGPGLDPDRFGKDVMPTPDVWPTPTSGYYSPAQLERFRDWVRRQTHWSHAEKQRRIEEAERLSQPQK